MKKSFIKKIAVYMAFFQLFSTSAYASSFKQVDNSNKVNPIYEKYDDNTKEYSNISIFDEDNIASLQYGADQNVFRSKFDELIKDPLIYKEVQKRFPIERFENEEDAMYYYRLYFDLIYANGCGYAAGTNYIFKLFEGREKEFYNTFGFPMYKVVDDKIDFNYEIMMLKFFNFHIIDSKKNIQDGYQEIYDEINHKFYEHKIMEFLENNPAPRLNDYDYMNWTEKEEKEFDEKVKAHDDRLHELYKLSESSKTVHHDLAIKGTATYGYIKQFLANYGIKIDTFAVYDYTSVDLDDLLIPTNFKLYELDENGNYTTYQDIHSHWVYVTDIKDGKIYVSSWGNKYGIDTSESKYQDKVVLKLSK
jgi:hypothetical protein